MRYPDLYNSPAEERAATRRINQLFGRSSSASQWKSAIIYDWTLTHEQKVARIGDEQKRRQEQREANQAKQERRLCRAFYKRVTKADAIRAKALGITLN